MNTLFEQLASIEHERWASWQRYVHQHCGRDGFGNLIIPKELVLKWERQIGISYSELSEEEKESDRDQVRRYWNLISGDYNVPKATAGDDSFVRIEPIGAGKTR